MKKIIVAFVFTLLAVVPGFAGDQGDRRLITVTGTSEVKVVPDEVQISLGVETLKKDLLQGKKANDLCVKKMLEVTKKFGIDPKDVQTFEISITPQYDYPSKGGRIFAGYMVQNTMVVTLKDLSKFDGFLNDMLAVGGNTLNGIGYQSSEMPKYKAEARKLAIQAAKEKAESLAGELDQKIGRPFTIIDQDNSWQYETTLANAESNKGGVYRREGVGISPGQITVRQNVTVSFEL